MELMTHCCNDREVLREIKMQECDTADSGTDYQEVRQSETRDGADRSNPELQGRGNKR